MYSQGKKARTIDQAKSALDASTRRYIVGLQKYNKQNNIDEEKKAHPLTVLELSTLLNALSSFHPFVGTMVRLALVVGFIGCFRISQYLSVRLRWHKKANIEEDSQVYHLVDDTTFPCLRVCAFHDDYISKLRECCVNVPKNSYVFPNFVMLHGGVPRVDWCRALEQTTLRNLIREPASGWFVLPSVRVPGATLQLSRAYGLVPLSRCENVLRVALLGGVPCTVDELAQTLAKSVQAFASVAVPAPKAWQQWFVADPGNGLTCALKDYSKEMIQFDRKKYSERHTLAMAFIKYQSFDQFEASYTGFTNSYARILKECYLYFSLTHQHEVPIARA
ncbi:hypothetical protein H257_12993 [Aphanomyces astaci]|uniref:Uncharacterized protein n=1 Tax=Aphanomyces astaci TaxID=112090 RepID=W4FWF1_APHAT|nr:hypothetical protein H257_12993 [Aphanomyces astaci]ETV71860.1 hypothetical protein H257_12993 [Aphanomyces astaci]|eukprot:XP_009838709.1 hypothetical protein H257_12993 [Aphanomyces astaci]